MPTSSKITLVPPALKNAQTASGDIGRVPQNTHIVLPRRNWIVLWNKFLSLQVSADATFDMS